MKTIVPNIPDAALDQHLAIMAKTGSGKSFTTRYIVERLLDLDRRVCVLDYTGVWFGLRSTADGKKAAYPVVIFGGEHGDVPLNEAAGPTLAKVVAEGNRPCIIDVDGMTVGAQQRFATAFFEELYRLNSKPLHLVIEEADEFAPQHGAPGTERMMSAVARIFQRGRRKGFKAIAITQRPANLHKRVLTQCNSMIALRLTAPQDRKALGEWIKGHGDDTEGKEVIDSLPKLKVGEGYIWAPEQDVLKRVQFPLIKTFDSMRAPVDGEDHEPATWADVDLETIRDDMAAAIDEAEANDPKKLKAEIKRLQTELAKGAGIAPGAILEAENRGFASGIVAGADAVLQLDSSEILKPISDAVGELKARIVRAIHAQEKRQAEKPQPRSTTPAAAVSRPQIKERRAAAVEPKDLPDGFKISDSRQRILDALYWFENIGVRQVDKVVLAFVADASATSSVYANNLGAMRSAGLLDYPRAGEVTLTEAGRDVATLDAAITSLIELHESIAKRLTRPQARILDTLIELYPKALAKTDLAERVEASATSSVFANNLGRLRSLGFIDYPQPGQVVATDLLFPEGLE